MNGLDTNVLVRYLTQDDPVQSPVAVREIEGAAARGESLLISPIVLCELVWVLDSAYGFPRRTIADRLEQILRTAQFEVLEKDIAWAAWEEYQAGQGDFADHYLGLRHERAGARATLTFDRELKTSKRFRILVAEPRSGRAGGA